VTEYLPLRSAVEYNPKYDKRSSASNQKEKFLNLVHPHRPRQSRVFNIEAFIVPINSPYDNDPLYYRVGSPYQELIDATTYERIQNGGQNSFYGSSRYQSKGKDYKVVCHTTNWSYYRKGDGKFVPENINYDLCTHIIYSFAMLEPEQFIMLEFDPWVDIENRLYKRTIENAKGKPVLLAMGGWTVKLKFFN
jgi:chitinase